MSKVYLYPTTNCDCGSCNIKDQKIDVGVPSNLSIPNCKVPKWFSCGDRIVFKDLKLIKNGRLNDVRNINPQLYQQQKSPYFLNAKNPSKEICFQNGDRECKVNKCPENVVVSQDARLFSAPRGDYMTLNEAPIESKPKFDKLYTDPDLINYGKRYSSYQDINAGNITYYNDLSQQTPYFSPNFPESNPKRNDLHLKNNIFQGVLYKDPMDNYKPEYPMITENRNLITQARDPYLGEYCLTELSDTTKQRQDILACQMAKRNSQLWTPRWADNN